MDRNPDHCRKEQRKQIFYFLPFPFSTLATCHLRGWLRCLSWIFEPLSRFPEDLSAVFLNALCLNCQRLKLIGCLAYHMMWYLQIWKLKRHSLLTVFVRDIFFGRLVKFVSTITLYLVASSLNKTTLQAKHFDTALGISSV